MFWLLRKVRDEVSSEGTRRYLHYAVGELLLVVVGILIALQIDNWNEERIEQRQIAEYAHALIEDLERDLTMATTIRAEIDVFINKIDTLAEYVESRSIDEMRNIDLFYLMRAPFYRPYSWNRAALEQIKNSGALSQMMNQELAAKIAAYEAFTRHLDGDFAFDRTFGVNSVVLAGTVVDMNYPDIHDLFDSTSPSTFTFPDSELHAAYEDTELALLTDDIENIKVAVNSYLILGDYYGVRPRADTEIPKLESDARELIGLLREEFPE